MPWEDILENLQETCQDEDLTQLPRQPECLKYMLRLHLRVGGVDFAKHLKQVHVRPFVVLKLLHFLIDRGHEVFIGKGSAAALKERMRFAVAARYPETEAHLPEERRQGAIPESILQLLREQETEKRRRSAEAGKAPRAEESAVAGSASASDSRRRSQGSVPILVEKNATPGDGARPVAQCLEDVRPKAFTLDRSTASCTDPDILRKGALERYGGLHVQTGSRFIDQWQSKYFSQVLPWVIPRMVSGPDYDPERKWRRRVDSPLWYRRMNLLVDWRGVWKASVATTGQACPSPAA
jgi:hypothetical protein